MLTKHANIFVIHTPFQNLIVHHMLMSMPEFHDEDNCLVLDMLLSPNRIVDNKWKEILFLNPPIGGSVIGNGKICRTAIERIKSITQNYQQCCLFLSDIEWPLNNALYGLMKNMPKERVLVCLFPDGLGSLLVQHPNMKRTFKNIIKSAFGSLGGFPYYTYKGDIMGFAVSDRIYSLMPEAICNKTNADIVTIPIMESSNYNNNSNSCIFLGQSYDNYMPLEAYKNLCLKAAKYSKDLGYRDMFYKPHHFSTTDVEREVFEEHGFALITDKRPIEECFLSNPMSCVVSYNSSALVHLKLMFGEKVRCIACFSKETVRHTNVNSKTYAEMRSVFNMSKVECYE